MNRIRTLQDKFKKWKAEMPRDVCFEGVDFRIMSSDDRLFINIEKVESSVSSVDLSVNQAEALYKFLKRLYE